MRPPTFDDAAAPADEEETALAELHHVAGVDVAVGIAERLGGAAEIAACRAGRADAERALVDFHRKVAPRRIEQARRKTLEAIIDGEADAGFSGGISVADAGGRVSRTKRVEDRLVGNLAG